MSRATLFLLLTLLLAPRVSLPAQDLSRSQADSVAVLWHLAGLEAKLAPIRQALATDWQLQRAPATETQFVLLQRTSDGHLVSVARYADRPSLHFAGRGRGHLVRFGWFRAGQVGPAAVYYYIVNAPQAPSQMPRLVPDA